MRAHRRHHGTTSSGSADRARPERTFVLDDRWSWTDGAVAALGVVLALAGLAALVGVGIAGQWTWLVAIWALIVTAVALAPPRRGRVERVVETH